MMMPPFYAGEGYAPLAITARQWQAAKQHATCFGSNKNRPGKPSRRRAILDFIRTLNQGAALSTVQKLAPATESGK